jgi:hypothetical protein
LILISVIGLFISILAQRSIKAAKNSVLNLQKIFLLNDIKVFEVISTGEAAMSDPWCAWKIVGVRFICPT